MADAIKDGTDEEKKDEAAAKGGGGSKKKWIIIGAIILVQGLIMVLANQFVIRPMVMGEQEGEIAEEEKESVRGTILILENIIVNVDDPDAGRFLKLSVGIEVENADVATEVDERRPELRDIVISSLSGRPVREIVSVEGKETIRVELKDNFGGSLQTGELMNVYFSEFVIQ